MATSTLPPGAPPDQTSPHEPTPAEREDLSRLQGPRYRPTKKVPRQVQKYLETLGKDDAIRAAQLVNALREDDPEKVIKELKHFEGKHYEATGEKPSYLRRARHRFERRYLVNRLMGKSAGIKKLLFGSLIGSLSGFAVILMIMFFLFLLGF